MTRPRLLHTHFQHDGVPCGRSPSESLPGSPSAPGGPAARPRAEVNEAGTTPRPGVVALRDPESEAEKVRALYEQLSSARRQAGEAEVPFERFREVVRAQVSKHAKEGTEVAFRIGMQDGRVTFTAKPKKDTPEE